MSVSRHSGINTGGINPVQYLFADEVDTYTVDANLEAEIIFTYGSAWKYLYATDATIVMDGKEELSPAGIKYIYQIDMLVPKDREEVELVLHGMNNRGMLIMAKNKNGTTRVFGTPDNPMRKKGQVTWAAETEGFNGYKLTFYGEFSSPAPYYPDVDSVIPFEEGNER